MKREIQTIPIDLARYFLLEYQGLNHLDTYGTGKEGILNLIDRLGCFQFDPLNIIGRNIDILLISRFRKYRQKDLQQLLYQDRMLIDGFDKEACVYSGRHWHYFERVREKRKGSYEQSFSQRNIDVLVHRDSILQQIEEKGGMFANEMVLGNMDNGGWGSFKISSVLMEYLFVHGVLGVSERNGIQRKYDLNSRLLIEHIMEEDGKIASEHEFMKWYIKRRISSIGFYWNRSGSGWLGYYLMRKKDREPFIKELVEEEELIPFFIEGIKDEFYTTKAIWEEMKHATISYGNEIRFIAPLDNVIWDRNLLKLLYGFEYSWEVYKPKDQRVYGHYVLPILYKGRFIGRFEASKPSEEAPNIMNRIYWEKDVKITKEIEKQLDKEIARYMKCMEFKHVKVKEIIVT